jgi:hypothetical protein
VRLAKKIFHALANSALPAGFDRVEIYDVGSRFQTADANWQAVDQNAFVALS